MSTPRLSLLTPTCDQPIGLALCERYLAAQTTTLADVQWIVVDDGVRPATLTLGQTHVLRTRTPHCTPVQSFCRNLLMGLAAVRAPLVAFIEHDDYYTPTHLERLEAQLADPAILLAGDDQQRYYHIRQRCWRLFQNRGASLCQTGLKAALLPVLVRVIHACVRRASFGVDAELWRVVDRQQQALTRTETVVGIKGLPGRPGLGIGHRPRGAEWVRDPDLAMLRSWIGADVDAYAGFAARRAA